MISPAPSDVILPLFRVKPFFHLWFGPDIARAVLFLDGFWSSAPQELVQEILLAGARPSSVPRTGLFATIDPASVLGR